MTDGQGNTAKVLCGNIPTSNATVFVIDKVLMAQRSRLAAELSRATLSSAKGRP